MPEPVHLPERIEADANGLYLQLQMDDRPVRVMADTQEYADAVMTILEGLYPDAKHRIVFEIVGRWPGTTG